MRWLACLIIAIIVLGRAGIAYAGPIFSIFPSISVGGFQLYDPTILSYQMAVQGTDYALDLVDSTAPVAVSFAVGDGFASVAAPEISLTPYGVSLGARFTIGAGTQGGAVAAISRTATFALTNLRDSASVLFIPGIPYGFGGPLRVRPDLGETLLAEWTIGVFGNFGYFQGGGELDRKAGCSPLVVYDYCTNFYDHSLLGGLIYIPLAPFESRLFQMTIDVRGFAAVGIPEPGSLALLGSGLVGLGAVMRRRSGMGSGAGALPAVA